MFDHLAVIKTLVSFSPRQLGGETKAAHFIVSFLKKRKVPFITQQFRIKLPVMRKGSLRADGNLLEAEPCCYVGGEILGKDHILSSLLPSTVCQNEPNINFNPKCPAVSPGNHYFAPAFAVSHRSLVKILKAQNVQGKVLVDPVDHQATNILAGNHKNPHRICIAHYDSIKKGALDNASGVSVLMGAILARPDTLENTLYVFSACEELSYEKPIYRGYGYRIFEKGYLKILQRAQKIIILECVGDGPPKVLRDPKMVEYGFPICNLKKLMSKIEIITGDFDHCMSVYHSDLDDGRGIRKRHLDNTKRILLRR